MSIEMIIIIHGIKKQVMLMEKLEEYHIFIIQLAKKTDPVNRTGRISYNQSTPTGIKKIGDHMLFESLKYCIFYRHKNR